MSNQIEYAQIEWRDGNTPIATRFGDPYFSFKDGPAETAHVFLAGNDLPQRYARGFHIAELGFGTALNLLCAWKAWEESGQSTPLKFTSFEAFAMRAEDMWKTQAAWPELSEYAKRFRKIWDPELGHAYCSTLSAHVIFGDARETLPMWTEKAHAWFLDGFSPAKNPELWGTELMGEVACHTRSKGTFATYSAAGHVRRALANAGFEVKRKSGYGRKTHMTHGTLNAGLDYDTR